MGSLVGDIVFGIVVAVAWTMIALWLLLRFLKKDTDED